MNESDSRIRKYWLTLLILSPLITITSTFWQQRFDPSFQMVPQTVRYISMAVSLLTALGFFLVAYYCAYKKPGTKFLTFCLILTAASVVSSPFFYLSERFQYLLTSIPYYRVYLALTQGTGLLWLIACWEMRKVNKKQQPLSKQLG